MLAERLRLPTRSELAWAAFRARVEAGELAWYPPVTGPGQEVRG